MIRRVLACLAVSALLAVGSAALTGAPSGGSAVRVTAVVTNARGEAVAGLRATDFQVTVDGVPQPVDEIVFNTATADVPRLFALVLDEFHVDAADSAAVKDALLPLVDNHLRQADRAIVFKPLDSLTSIHPTDNVDALRASITAFEGRQGDYSARTDFEKRYMAQAPNAVIAARAQIISSALRAVAGRLGEIRGIRPAVVLVSNGFARQRGDRSLPGNLLSAVRIANRGDVPIYVFTPGVFESENGEGVNPARAALQAVAAQTGGDYNEGLASFASGLARMVRELDAHYVLTYRPPHGDDGRFHSVQVTLKRPDVRVRARAGYVAPLPLELRARMTSAPAPVRVVRRSTLIQSWSGLFKAPNGKARVVFTWEPAPARPGATRTPPAVLVVTASTPGGSVLFDGNIAAVGASSSSTAVNRAEFEAPAGRVLIDVKILDSKGVVLDTDARDIDVPNLDAARPTILPPAVLRTASAREFRLVSEDPDAPPVPSREFRRTERLLLRVPAYDDAGAPARVSATLLNRWRQPMRALPAMDSSRREGVTQFDIPLAPLPPGEYTIRLTAGSVTEHVTFRVRG